MDLIIVKLIRKILEPQKDNVNKGRPGKVDFFFFVGGYFLL